MQCVQIESLELIYYYYYYYYSKITGRIFPKRVSWWAFTRVWVKAKSLPASWILLNILKQAVDWIVSTLPPISNCSNYNWLAWNGPQRLEPFQFFEDCSKCTNYNWCHHVSQLFLSFFYKVQISVYFFQFLLFPFYSPWEIQYPLGDQFSLCFFFC